MASIRLTRAGGGLKKALPPIESEAVQVIRVVEIYYGKTNTGHCGYVHWQDLA